MRLHAQGAIESCYRTTARTCRGQGATEYLVLLAVVLVIALVGIALLGFFPGTASDAQVQESQIYWQSQTPIAITETSARSASGWAEQFPYLRIRNAGSYPLRITRVIGGDQSVDTIFCSGLGGCTFTDLMSNYFYLAPGEESYFGSYAFGTVNRHFIPYLGGGGTSGSYHLYAASSVCQNSAASPGVLEVRNFGFEYVQYIEGQQITKREIGTKPLIIKCREPY